MKKPRIKPNNPKFSSGPTRKPDGWSLKKINKNFLGRYHRSGDTKSYIANILEKLKKTLNIPKKYKIFLVPGSCTGAMESVIWSVLGERSITSITYDFWGEQWNRELKKKKLEINLRKSLNGKLPDLDNISSNDDIIFVWTGTSTGMTVSDIDFIPKNHNGLVISDITSSVFIYDLPWSKIDISVFSWQKALGSESQHGIIVISPKVFERIRKKKDVPKILDLSEFDFLVNTPSLLALSDFDLCLDLYIKEGGLEASKKKCLENKSILDKWEKNCDHIEYFSKIKENRALTPCYFVFRKKFDYDDFFNYLSKEKVAFDLRNYKEAKPGIRIWTGPTIKKKDLINLTNWLDWSFYKFVK